MDLQLINVLRSGRVVGLWLDCQSLHPGYPAELGVCGPRSNLHCDRSRPRPLPHFNESMLLPHLEEILLWCRGQSGTLQRQLNEVFLLWWLEILRALVPQVVMVKLLYVAERGPRYLGAQCSCKLLIWHGLCFGSVDRISCR
jgi:hypothetical protein